MRYRKHTNDRGITYRELSMVVRDRKASVVVANFDAVDPRWAIASSVKQARNELRAFVASETASS